MSNGLIEDLVAELKNPWFMSDMRLREIAGDIVRLTPDPGTITGEKRYIYQMALDVIRGTGSGSDGDDSD